MTWEQLKKGLWGRAAHERYGPDWLNSPAIALTNSGITFNKPFLKAFGFQAGSVINVFISREQKKIGFKKPTSETDQDAAFKIASSGKSRHSIHVSCKKVIVAFPEQRGRAFPAHLNSGESIIEVNLHNELNGQQHK